LLQFTNAQPDKCQIKSSFHILMEPHTVYVLTKMYLCCSLLTRGMIELL